MCTARHRCSDSMAIVPLSHCTPVYKSVLLFSFAKNRIFTRIPPKKNVAVRPCETSEIIAKRGELAEHVQKRSKGTTHNFQHELKKKKVLKASNHKQMNAKQKHWHASLTDGPDHRHHHDIYFLLTISMQHQLSVARTVQRR